MSTHKERIIAVAECIDDWIQEGNINGGRIFTISARSREMVAEILTDQHERNFDDPDAIDGAEFVEDIEQAWSERLIEQHLIAPTQEDEVHFTAAEHGIDATITIWSKSHNLTATGDNAGHYMEDLAPFPGPGPGRLFRYDDQMWNATIDKLLASAHGVSTSSQFVATHDEVVEDGDFSAEIRVHREKIDGEPDYVKLRHTQHRENIGEIPIYYDE